VGTSKRNHQSAAACLFVEPWSREHAQDKKRSLELDKKSCGMPVLLACRWVFGFFCAGVLFILPLLDPKKLTESNVAGSLWIRRQIIIVQQHQTLRWSQCKQLSIRVGKTPRKWNSPNADWRNGIVVLTSNRVRLLVGNIGQLIVHIGKMIVHIGKLIVHIGKLMRR
jgi:hypothetical protein